MLNHIVWVVFDSARYDCFAAARTPSIDRIGESERRYSYASWTAPSHYAFLMGLPPHANEPRTFAAESHRKDLGRWRVRIGGDDAISLSDFVPTLSLPAFLKSLGYRTEAYVSLPVLNAKTPLAQHFDRYELMPVHNDFGAILAGLSFGEQPRFIFINTGETHYPYLLPNEEPGAMPYLPGVHGVWRGLDDPRERSTRDATGIQFDLESLRPLWRKQVACIEHLDRGIGRLIDLAPPATWLMVTSDHGELFGEDGYFGHGPVVHEKVFEVFFVEGLNPRQRELSPCDDGVDTVLLRRLRELGYA
jgi:hypothetical protein